MLHPSPCLKGGKIKRPTYANPAAYAAPTTPRMPRTVIIMGASSGLGYGLAARYIAAGCHVGLAARRTEPLHALAQQAPEGCRVEVACIDVCQPRQAADALQQLLSKLGGRLDLYLHCSGIGRMTPTLSYDDEEPTLLTNVMGWTACIDWAWHILLQQRSGQLAAITSFAANRGLAPAPSYSASKAFQAHYLEALRQRALAHRLPAITVTDLRPGIVATPLLAHPERLFWVLTTEQAVRALHRAIEQRRQVATVTRRWALFAPLVRWAPRRLVAAILRRAL